MVRRFRRSIYDELDELRASMDYLYQLALEPVDDPLLPVGDTPGIVCQCLHNLNAEVTETGDDVLVTMDTIPGTGSSRLSVALINTTTLKISCDREEEECDSNGNLHEQRQVSLHHVIPLPYPVITRGARMSLRHGVLDICLKKVQHEQPESH